MKINAFIDGKTVITDLSVTMPRQVPYAAAVMLSKIAREDLRPGFQQRLPEVFDRPTDFTIRGVFTKPASARELEALVYFPESQEERGKPKREYMRPGAEGTAARNQKKTEFLLTRIGVLPAGWVTTPGRGAKLDSRGNISGRTYAQIINVLQLKATAGGRAVAERSQKRARKLGVDAEFFAVAPGPNRLSKGGGWLPPGVWKHLPGRRITQILKFVKRAGYKPRFHVKDEGLTIVRRVLPARWREAVQLIAVKFSQPRGGR